MRWFQALQWVPETFQSVWSIVRWNCNFIVETLSCAYMWWGTDILNDLYMMRYGYAVENQEVGHAIDQEQTAHCYVLTWQFRFYCFLLISLCWKETAFIEIDMRVRRRQLWSNQPLFKKDPPSQQPVITYKQIMASKNVHIVYCTSHGARYTNANCILNDTDCTLYKHIEEEKNMTLATSPMAYPMVQKILTKVSKGSAHPCWYEPLVWKSFPAA